MSISKKWLECTRPGQAGLGVLAFALVVSTVYSDASAQTAPNAGTLLREYEKTAPVAPSPSIAPVEAGSSVELPAKQGAQVLVKRFSIEAHQFSEDELQP